MAKEPVAFFVGSYVSVWPPSNVPSVWALRKSIVEALAEETPRLTSRDKVQLADLLDGKPRLETIVEELEYRIGVAAIDFLDSVKGHSPNYLHRWLAQQFIAQRVPAIYTTNFDTCLGEALTDLGWVEGVDYISWIAGTALPIRPTLPCIYHLHGSIENKASVCATLVMIARQRSSEWGDLLLQDLHQHPFCFIGYSGLDIDVRPVLLRSKPREILWIDLPASLGSPSHLCQQLCAQGKKIIPIGGDLKDFPLMFGDPPLSSYVPTLHVSSLLPFVGKMTESCGLYVLSRMLWRIGTDGHKESASLLEIADRVATTASDRWPVYYQRGTVWLGKSLLLIRNVRAFINFRLALRESVQAGDVFGQIFCLRGMGMSCDMLFYGLLRWPYRISMWRWYQRAIRLCRHVGDRTDRRFAHALTLLLIARARLHIGQTAKAKRILEKLTREDTEHVRGHAFRYLALTEADYGKNIASLLALLTEAEESFVYSESLVEQADVMRVKAICELLSGDTLSSRLSLARALSIYHKRTSRGVVRIRWLQFLAQLQNRIPRVRASRWWRRQLLR